MVLKSVIDAKKINISFQNIVIFGVGLLGGSLALSLKNKGIFNIVGIDINVNNLKVALAKKAIDKGIVNIDKDIIYRADLIILCTPVLSYSSILSYISNYLNSKVIITDIGSTKRDIIKKFFTLIPDAIIPNCVASHPIAGSQKSGADYIDANLFKGKKIFISAHEKQNQQALMQIINMWQTLGVQVYNIDYNEHDFIFAYVSHLPHVLAFVYANLVFSIDKNLVNYAGNGFKDFTRIAASNADVWIDIFFENSDFLVQLIDKFNNNLINFKNILINKDKVELKEFILSANKLLEHFNKNKNF